MHRRSRSVLPACCLLIGAASAAHAKPPDPAHCTIPRWIDVVGRVHDGAAPDPLGEATFVMRDFARNPLPGTRVILDFSACCDLRLCSAIVNGQTVDCASRRVTGVADAHGEVRLTVLGAAIDPGAASGTAPGPGRDAVRVWADFDAGPYPIASLTAVVLDQDGALGSMHDGVDLLDAQALFHLFGATMLGGGVYVARGDLNHDGVNSVADVTEAMHQMGRLQLLGGVGCDAAYCPGAACP